jgi:hypothetical protein
MPRKSGDASMFRSLLRVEMENSSLREAKRRSNPFFRGPWIASRSLSSDAHSRNPVARNDDLDVGA